MEEKEFVKKAFDIKNFPVMIYFVEKIKSKDLFIDKFCVENTEELLHNIKKVNNEKDIHFWGCLEKYRKEIIKIK